jgi:plastocyanin
VRIATFAGALGLMVGLVGSSAAEESKARARTHTVTIEAMRFQPTVVVVAPGDTVVWINKDLVAHTATSQVGGFDSSVIPASDSWRYTVQKKKGDFPYICTLHPAMKGTLRVK